MKRRTKRALVPVLATIMIIVGLTAGVSASTNIHLPSWGDDTQGELRAGPLGLNPAPDTRSAPVSIQIPDAEVDAEVERNQIVDGVMLNPSGPWVVSWYQETGLLGEVNNAVMSGHVDYWDVGPAVFWTIAQLPQGSRMDVRGENGATYTYEVEWIKTYDVAGLTPEAINEIVGPTDYRALTLITCGGDFNYDTGEYLSRTVIRGRLVDSQGTTVPDNAIDTGGITIAAEPSTETEAEVGGSELAVGSNATVTGSGVNLRSSATTSAEVVETLSEGQQVSIVGGPEEADGYTWWLIEMDGNQGWIAGDFLAP